MLDQTQIIITKKSLLGADKKLFAEFRVFLSLPSTLMRLIFVYEYTWIGLLRRLPHGLLNKLCLSKELMNGHECGFVLDVDDDGPWLDGCLLSCQVSFVLMDSCSQEITHRLHYK